MSITPLPTPPSRQDPANFASRADQFLGQLPTFANEANALALDVNNKQITATNAANTATSAATTATNAANTATASSNYKGEWSTLSGALNIPASVSHNDSLWNLKVNLADVTLSEPTTANSDWMLINKPQPSGDIVGTTDTQTLSNKTIVKKTSVISTSTTAVRSTVYVLTADLILTLPTSPSVGDWVSVVNRSNTITPTIARNGQPIMGLAEDMTIDDFNASFTLVYADATRGWVIN